VNLGAVILAGGASRRMGSPKALLEIGGETFLDRMLRIFHPVAAVVIVVLGFDHARVRSGIRSGRLARFTVNPSPERGQFSSLQHGLRELPAAVEGFFFCPLDFPALLASTPEALARRFASRTPDELLFMPRFQARRGHPVLAAAELKDAFLALPPLAQARDVTRRLASSTVYVDVNDPGILRDVDDPAGYRLLVGNP